MYAIAAASTAATIARSALTKAELEGRIAAAQRGRIYVRSTRV